MTPGTFNALLIIWLIVLTALALVSLALSEATRRDLKSRSELLSKISNLRLSSMLSKRKINIATYIRQHPPEAIATEATNCEDCTDLEKCDKVLADESLQSFDFCPNCDNFDKFQNS
jgi:hypothetical protein